MVMNKQPREQAEGLLSQFKFKLLHKQLELELELALSPLF
jgi:hypothetical protein